MNDKTGAKAMISRNQRPQKAAHGKGSTVVQVPKGKLGALNIPFPANRLATSKPQKKEQPKGVQKPVTAKRTYVLDTNVLMHDPSCLFHFKEHDIVIPFMVLEELDNNKQGNDDKNRNVRQVSRTIESLFNGPDTIIGSGVSLEKISNGQATGKLSVHAEINVEKDTKPDNIILKVVRQLKDSITDREVVLVSKDINMRLKARTMGLLVEDYTTDLIEAKDGDYLHPGYTVMPDDFWEKHAQDLEARHHRDVAEYTIHGKDVKNFHLNQFVLSDGTATTNPFAARIIKKDGNSATLQTVTNYKIHDIHGIKARNAEQNFALNLLMDEDIHCVSLAGIAGTGKTMLALAAGLRQVFDDKRYSEIIFTRATVSVGDDIGFLPGNEHEKMAPWLGALYDNLEVLTTSKTPEKDSKNGPDWNKAATDNFIHSRIKICSMSFIRGRTFVNKYIIIDEVQNLTPKQVKTLVTRAGEGTKMILMGNLAQIDTPYLTEGSCGLTHLANNFQGQPHTGHVTLEKGERSWLADLANEVL